MSEFVKVSKEGRIATITIDRPKALNALSSQVLLEIRSAVIGLEGSSVAIFTGAGDRAFVAGADVAALSEMDVMAARTFVELGQGVMQVIQEAPFISIAAVNGFALGGGLELALACDLIYASKTAKLGLPETNLGIIPGFGGTVHLLQRVGFYRTMEMILSGKPVSAEDARGMGLVLQVFEQNELMPKVKEIAEQLSKKGILSMLAARRLVRQNASLEHDRSLLLERETFANLFATSEPREGTKAFLEKRTPNF